MAQDIIKQIILQFKSSGSDQVKRTAESISKAMNPRDADRFLKSMEQLQSTFKKTGTAMSADWGKVNDYVKELSNVHLKNAKKQMDELGESLRTQMEEIERLKKTGASAASISAKELEMLHTTNKVNELASQTPVPRTLKGYLKDQIPGLNQMKEIGGLLSPGAKMIGGSALGLAGLSALISSAASTVNEIKKESMENRTYVANAFKQQARDVFEGDMSRAVLYSDPRRASKIASDRAVLDRSQDIATGGRAIGGTIMTGAGAIIGGLALGPMGAMAGAYAGSKAGEWLGFGGAGDVKNAYSYFYQGGRQTAQEQNKQMAEKTAASTTMNMEYYNYLREKAPMRMQYQRQLQMGDEAALVFRQKMRSSGVIDEGQMASLAGQFRQFGTQSAPMLGIQAARMARLTGQDANTTAQIMANIAGTNKGGAANAGGDFYKLFSEAVKAGIDDSALIEEYQKSTTSLMNIFKGRMDAAQASDIFGKYLTGTSDRDIKGAAAAMQSFGATVGGVSPLMQQKKTAAMLDLAGGDFLKFQMLNRVSNEQLANLSPDQMKELGIDPLKYNKFMKEQFERTMMSATDRQSVQAIFKRSAGKTMSQEDQNALYSLFNPGKSPFDATPQERQSFLQRVMDVTGRKMDFQWETPTGTTTGKLTPKDEKTVSEKIKGTEGFAAKQVDVTGKGQTEIDIKSANQVAKDADRILAVFAKQSAEIGKQLDSGVLAKSVGDVSNAADQLATVMTEAAKKINTSWNLGVPQTSSKQPGE